MSSAVSPQIAQIPQTPHLPTEIWIQIFPYCDYFSLLHLEATCRTFNDILRHTKHPDIQRTRFRIPPTISQYRRIVERLTSPERVEVGDAVVRFHPALGVKYDHVKDVIIEKVDSASGKGEEEEEGEEGSKDWMKGIVLYLYGQMGPKHKYSLQDCVLYVFPCSSSSCSPHESTQLRPSFQYSQAVLDELATYPPVMILRYRISDHWHNLTAINPIPDSMNSTNNTNREEMKEWLRLRHVLDVIKHTTPERESITFYNTTPPQRLYTLD